MIVLNTGKELVRIESWEDMIERPGFMSNLNPAEHELRDIIGQYVFADQKACGLSICHQKHNRGYLVVTKSGRETNIGKDCGKTHFNVDFGAMEVRFNRDMREKIARERVWDFSFRVDEVRTNIQALRGGADGADWVYRTSQALKETARGVPSEIVRRVSAMIRTGQTTLTMTREASEDEARQAELGGQRLKRPYYIEERVGELLGLEALYQENDLREILVLQLDEELKVFETLDLNVLSPNDMSKWSKWIGSVDGLLARAETSIQAGRTLLTAKNLEPLVLILTDQEDKARFRKYLGGLPNGRGQD